MVAGALSDSGYFQGGALHAPRAANPRGFFEAASVNSLNDTLLRGLRPKLPDGQGWLCALEDDEVLPSPSPAVTAQMRSLTQRVPFCFKDPRFSYTLPLWRPHLPPDCGLIAVFRHPLLTATSIVEETRRASYLRGRALDLDGALAVWAAIYRRILSEMDDGLQPWLPLHYDQMLDGTGPQRLRDFLGAPINDQFADRTMRRPPPAGTLPAEIAELYDALCERAGHAPAAARAAAPSTTVSVVAVIEDDDIADLPRLTEAARAQRGVTVELVLVDSTTDQTLDAEGARIVPAPSASRGACYHAALSQVTGKYVAWADGRCWRLPNQLARLAELLDAVPAAAMVVGDYHLSHDGDRFLGTVKLKEQIDAPPPGWRSGVLMRRAALELVEETAFWPVELALLKTLRGVQRVLHLSEPLFCVDADRFEADMPAAAQDAAALAVAASPWEGPPALTVSLCTYNRKATLRACLDALCRQSVPPGAFSIALVNDGSSDGTREMLDAIGEWPIPVSVIHRENGGLAAARNTGLEQITAPLVLFINDDTIAAGDLIQAHLDAHRRHPGAGVLGSFPQPPEEMARNLTHAVETADLMFCYGKLSAEQPNLPMFLYTCNASVETARVKAAGSFDEAFRHYGAEDTDLALRMGQQGMTVRYVPQARATHRHPYSFGYVQRRARMVARAHIRLWKKHPDQAFAGNILAGKPQLPPDLAAKEAAAAQLAPLNLDTLRAGGLGAIADAASQEMVRLLKELTVSWWQQGLSEGLQEHGYPSLMHLLAEHPIALPEAHPTTWILVPTQDAAQQWVERVVQFRDRFSSSDPVTLVLLASVPGGYTAEALAEGLRDFSGPGRPHLSIVQTGLAPVHAVRLFAAASGWVPTTSSSADARWSEVAAAAGCPAVALRPDRLSA